MSKHWTSEDIEDQSGRVAVVTGANSGIGYETAKALAEKNATVIVACRSAERGGEATASLREQIPDAKVELMLIDLASLESVRNFVADFKQRHQRLDLLINNAGIMMPPKREETADGFELQIGVNHLGHFALTLQLLDLLIATPGSRVVNVSSSAQNFGGFDVEDLQWSTRKYKRIKSYGQSKIANMLFTLELQRRLENAGVSTIATAAHPGWTATNLQKDVGIARVLNPVFAMKPWQGALPSLYAAVSEDVEPGAYYGPDGFGTWRGYPSRNRPADASVDEEAAKRLWEVSEQLVQVRMPQLAQAA